MMPGDTKTHVARQAKKRKSQAKGDIKALRIVLWRAINKLSDTLDKIGNSTDKEEIANATKLTHAIGQASTVYIKSVEAGEFETRLAEMEKELNDLKN